MCAYMNLCVRRQKIFVVVFVPACDGAVSELQNGAIVVSFRSLVIPAHPSFMKN